MKLDLKVVYPKVEQNSREKDRKELTCIIEARNNAASTNADAKLGDFWMREEEREECLCRIPQLSSSLGICQCTDVTLNQAIFDALA